MYGRCAIALGSCRVATTQGSAESLPNKAYLSQSVFGRWQHQEMQTKSTDDVLVCHKPQHIKWRPTDLVPRPDAHSMCYRA